MLVAAAFAPHPPLIVPQLAAGAAAELDTVRAACDDAVRRLCAAGPGLVVILGSGPAAGWWSSGDVGTFAGYGLDLEVPLVPASAAPAAAPQPTAGSARLPLSVTIGAWLLCRCGYQGRRLGFMVPATASAAELAGWAKEITRLDDRLGLLVMGDGSARRSRTAPGYLDPRAVGLDAAVAGALGSADLAALRELNPTLGADLLAAGVPAWRLAGHVAARAGGPPPAGELLYAEAPYGVGYLVAVWQQRGTRS